jgi:hypothetical protein
VLHKVVKTIFIVIGIIAGILGYGYWHSVTHASFHVQIDYKDGTNGTQETVPKTTVEFLNSKGQILAQGISDDQYNYVHLIHPEVGDCREIEKSAAFTSSGKNAWQECYEHMSTWITQWASKVRQVNLKTDLCTWKNIPVSVSANNSDWFLWWVPHPHIGGKPSTYFSLYITVEENDCESLV